MIACMKPLCGRAHQDPDPKSKFLSYTIPTLAPNSADKRLVNGFASLGLTPALLAKAFPFHLALDRQGRVLQTGAVLRRLCPGLVAGSPAQASIRIHDPKIPLD